MNKRLRALEDAVSKTPDPSELVDITDDWHEAMRAVYGDDYQPEQGRILVSPDCLRQLSLTYGNLDE